ncbi:hypothetical protein GCM10010207_07920 [Streptomyces atratus]|nr:hypothetical protein GCM10010207_07920 [Streptomyces atratus]
MNASEAWPALSTAANPNPTVFVRIVWRVELSGMWGVGIRGSREVRHRGPAGEAPYGGRWEPFPARGRRCQSLRPRLPGLEATQARMVSAYQ